MNFNSGTNKTLPPLTIISKGKAVLQGQVLAKQLQQQAVKHVPPLTVISKLSSSSSSGVRIQKAAVKTNQPQLKVQKNLIVKKYGKVSAPAPFFAKSSKIPKPTVIQPGSSKIEVISNEVITEAINAYLDADLDRANNQNNQNVSDLMGEVGSLDVGNNYNVVQAADKAVQTDCFCNCLSRRDDTNVIELARELATVKLSVDELKGKRQSSMIANLFPIKDTKDLERIEYNYKNTENFGIRLNLFLKYLKPRMSNTITTAFKELISDEFLKKRNWDGAKRQNPINVFEFFNTTLFEAWQNAKFTKDVYVDAMKAEIKKAHDRLNQRKRRQNDI